MDFNAVAEELYGLPLDDFVSTRKEREQQAKEGKDEGLAAEIHRVTKPNTVAWLANQLVRHCSEDIRSLLELGLEMREATANLSGDRLRDLSRQQHQLTGRLMQEAERLANTAGRQLGPDVARGLEETLHAALADQDASDALAAGRLTAGLHSTGFGSLDGGGNRQSRSARTPRSAATDRSRPRLGKGQRKSADTEAAKANVAEALQAREVAHAGLQQAQQTLASADDQVAQLRRELHEAIAVQSRAGANLRRVQAECDRLDRRSKDAQRRLEALEKE